MKLLIKILSLLSGCFIIFMMAMASNSQWFDKICKYLPQYRYGDLYMFSCMPGYRTPCYRSEISPQNLTPNNISLTILGDSYMRPLDSLCFYANQYNFVHWDNVPDTIPKLDSNKINILLVETTERYCRWRLKNRNPIFIGEKKEKKSSVVEVKLGAEDNLQLMITNQDFVLPFKEWKSFIYLKCFDRFDSRVAKPDGKGRLYFDETINPENSAFCYNPVSDIEINDIVNGINAMSENAKKSGFQKVYFSIIPNSASIYHHSELPYNHVIERIQDNPNLKVPFIDTYHLLKKQKNSVFYCNDSHWNSLGQILWLTYINALLKNEE